MMYKIVHNLIAVPSLRTPGLYWRPSFNQFVYWWNCLLY